MYDPQVSLRFNIITNEWVIIAPRRAFRPQDFRRTDSPLVETPAYREDCPFCPGNEGHAPSEVYRLKAPGGAGWQTRVVYNKYPALSHDIPYPVRHNQGLKYSVDGFGIHEVIVETPRHDMTLALLDTHEVEAVLATYRSRYRACCEDPRIAHIIIFKNHGERAGTSLVHPHSQLVATPVVSYQVADRLRTMEDHQEQSGRCLACRMLAEEIEDGVRILQLTEHFVAFIPYAALSSFHLWIYPRKHRARFGDLTDEELEDLARTLRTILRKLHYGLNNPDFNYVIRSAPSHCDEEDFHWYLSIVPRLSRAAGFELGSGMYINASLPEESAAFLRSVELPEELLAPTQSGEWEIVKGS
ncbi:MAG: galactose-1-phosphate uridylyltransferase [Bradymonadales bacterium]|nr:galactose-1-phosphate uridylyltransferase [Bradymonadales bacterium]